MSFLNKNIIQLVKSDIGYYFIFGLIARSIPVLLLPIIMRALNTSDVANLMLFISLFSFFTMFFMFGTQNTLTREYFSNHKNIHCIVFNSVLLISLISIIAILIVFIVSSDRIYLYAVINAWALSYVSYLLVYYRISGLVIRYGVVDIVRVSSIYIISICLIILTTFDLRTVVISNVVIVFFISIYHLFSINYKFSNAFNYKQLKLSFWSGFKITPHYLVTYGLMLLDKLLIKNYSTDDVLAQYSAGFMLGMLVILFTDAFNKYWSPRVVEMLTKGKKEVVINESKKLAAFLVLIIPVTLLLIYFVSYLYFPENYSLSRTVAIIVGFVFMLQVLYILLFPFLIHANLVDKMGGVSVVSALFGAGIMCYLSYLKLYQFLPIGILITFLGQVVGMILILKKANDAH